MLTILNEVHFWTLRDDINVSDTDFGAFRYYDKKSAGDSSFSEGKKNYAEKRGMQWVLTNKRPHKLKDSLRELEECLSQQRIVLSQWRDSALLQIVFSSGLLANIFVNIYTGDVLNIVFDKFLVGKLLSEYIVGAVLTKSHLVCAYNDNQLTLVYFTKPALKRTTPKLLNRLDPRIQTLELAGPPGRRMERKLSCNVSGDMILVWWHSCQDEVFPWSPHFKEEDRANILIYGITGVKSELLCHHKSEHDPLRVAFSDVHSNILHCAEQKVSRKGEVTVENAIYEISRSGLQRLSLSSIPLPTHVCCHGFNPGQEKLLIGCVDGSLVLFDRARGITHTVKAAFIPSVVSWHPEGAFVFVANERAQLQVLDATLSCIRQQFLGEDGAPGNILDLAVYLRGQPTLHNLLWANKSDAMIIHVQKYAPMDSLLLLVFERGPLATLRLVGGGGILGDIHGGGGLSLDTLVAHYLWVNQVDRAINLLQACSWDVHGSTCLSALYRITNYLFKRPLTPEREDQLQNALGTFHLPVRPMCPATIEEFAAPVRDLTRRFFHHLLRYHLFEKAFRLAIDLQYRDLFLDIHFAARQAGQMDLAAAAYTKAEELDEFRGTDDTASSHSVCSRSSCSLCTSDEAPLSRSGSSCTENAEDENQGNAAFSRRGSHRTSLRQRRRPVGRSGSNVDSVHSSARRRRPDAVSGSALSPAQVPVESHQVAGQTPPVGQSATVLGSASGSAANAPVATSIRVDSKQFYQEGTASSLTSLRGPGPPYTDLNDAAYEDNGDISFSDEHLNYNANPASRSGNLTVCDYPTTSNQQQQHIRQLLLNHLNSHQQSVFPAQTTPALLSSSSSSLSKSTGGVANNAPVNAVSQDPPAQTAQTNRVHEKPKVKFSDTVMQISVPDRLDTVLEETEDQLPYRSLPDSLNSYYGSLKTSGATTGRSCYSLQSFPSFYDQVVTTCATTSSSPAPASTSVLNLVANVSPVKPKTEECSRSPTFAIYSSGSSRKTESSTSSTTTTCSSAVPQNTDVLSLTPPFTTYSSVSSRRADESCFSPAVATYSAVPARTTDQPCFTPAVVTYSSVPVRTTDEPCAPPTAQTYSSVYTRKTEEPCFSPTTANYLSVSARKADEPSLTQTVTYSSVISRKTDESCLAPTVVAHSSLASRKTSETSPSPANASYSCISSREIEDSCLTPTFSNYPPGSSRETDRPLLSCVVTAGSFISAQDTDEDMLSSSAPPCPTLQWVITDRNNSRSIDYINNVPATSTTVTTGQSNAIHAVCNSQPNFANVWTGHYDNQVQGVSYDSNIHHSFNSGRDSQNKSYPFDEVAIYDRVMRQSSLKTASKPVLQQSSDWQCALRSEPESVQSTYVSSASSLWNTAVNEASWRSDGASSEMEQSWSADGPNDPLEPNANMELDLSSLLPGSRKSVAPSSRGSNGLPPSMPLKPPITRTQSDPSYLLKYINIPDLSEEEESNGSIKVVHFGVV